MDYEKLVYIFWLKNLKGLGPIAIRSLIKYFGSSKSVFEAPDSTILEFVKLQKTLRTPMAKAIIEGRDRIVSAREKVGSLLEEAEKLKAKIVSIEDEDYPETFRECVGEPPPILFIRGSLVKVSDSTIAVVGTRNATQGGLLFANEIASLLAKENWTVISGLAKGIDASAHSGVLSVQGNTVAILGCGVDRIYPPENKLIYEKIIESGAVISEFPFQTPPSAENLRKRNKTIVSFSKTIVVVEAPLDSGAMIAVKFAKEQRKPLFSPIPKNIRHKEVLGIVKILASGEAIPLETPVQATALIKGVVSNPSQSEIKKWDRFIIENERKILKEQIEATRQKCLTITLEAQNELVGGDFTNEVKELGVRLHKLYDIGWHSVKLNKFDELISKKELSTTSIGKVFRSKIIDMLNMIIEDIEAYIFLSQCKHREELEKKKIESIIFDLDGVVVDSREIMKNAYTEVIRSFLGAEPNRTVIQRIIGLSPLKVLRLMLKDKYSDRAYETFKNHFLQNIRNVKVPNGIKETIQGLLQKGIKIGLITSQPQSRMDKILSTTGLKDLFMTQMHWGSTVNKKPHAEPLLKMLQILHVDASKSVYIGDNAIDIIFARNAGVIPITALWANTCTIDEFLEYNPGYFLTSCDRLPFSTED